MLAYYLSLARRSFRKNLALTLLMVFAIAIGVGASMTTLTVLHVLAQDPIPAKSKNLYYVLVDPRRAGSDPGDVDPPDQLTRRDAEALVRAHKADHQALMTGGAVGIESDRANLAPFIVDSRWATTEFFPMFDVPFLAGGGWTADDDANAARVVVIAKPLAEKVFGSVNVVGNTLRIGGTPMRIVGVTDTWNPQPHYYDLNTGSYGANEQVWAPFSTSRELKLPRNGSMNCFGMGEPVPDPTALGAPCDWIQMWVELDSPSKATAYKDFLTQYSRDEKAAGRFQRDPNVRMTDVMDWLTKQEVVPKDVKLSTWIALGFLIVCLLNTVGLMLTKFLRRAGELGVRRALGASKRSIFAQLIVEAAGVGLAGGILGLGLAWLGLHEIQKGDFPFAEIAQMDVWMLGATFVLAIVASLLAGALPAWRACQIAPALQLKSQ